VQLFGSDVAVAVLEKQLRQGKPLSRRPQTGLAQPPEGGGEWRSAFHAVDIGRRDPKANTGIAGSDAQPRVDAARRLSLAGVRSAKGHRVGLDARQAERYRFGSKSL